MYEVTVLSTVLTKIKMKENMLNFFYLNQKYDEKVEIGNPPELLKQVFWDEVPKCVLKT